MTRNLRSLLLLGFVLALPLLAQAQLTKLWEKTAGSGGTYWWFQTASNNNMSLTLNAATNHLLANQRADRIYVVTPDSGNVIDSLNNTGTSGTYRFNRLATTSDGVIYAASLATGAGTFTIYRWANETAAPTVAAAAYVMVRTGDAFAVTGSGTNTVIYVSGSASTKIYKLTTTDGSSFAITDSIIVASGLARGAISPVGDGTFWVDASGTSTSHINATGTVLNAVSGGLLSTGWHQVKYFTVGGKKLIVMNGKNDVTDGPKLQVWDVTTSETNPTLLASVTQTAAYNTNANATADMDLKDNGNGTYTIYQIKTNNVISAYTLAPILVTFRLNTATVSDTVGPNYTVQVRGGASPLTWDGGSVNLTNTVGDYWQKTVGFPVGQSVDYKYFVGDWEGGGNKNVVASKDTVLPLAWFNNGFTAPFTSHADSVSVQFRVNMGSSSTFNPSVNNVGVRGANAPISWGSTIFLAREGTTKFFSGVITFPKATTDTVSYKFVTDEGGIAWENDPNRIFKAVGDTTLHWTTWNRLPILTIVPETVSVHFFVNTATLPDTMRPVSTVQIRGGTPPLTWGNDTPIRLTNLNGDYWTGTAKFVVTPGTSIQYKFFTNHLATTTGADFGWEQNTTDGSGNRILAFPAVPAGKDTILPLQYVNATPTAQPQYWVPWAHATDSVAVLFRVNMQSNQGFSANQVMGVRGSQAPLDWGKTLFLTRESQHGNGQSAIYNGLNFWSGVAKFPKTVADSTIIYYKFVIHNATDSTTVAAWEDGIPHGPVDVEGGVGSNPARIFTFNQNMMDTTLYWKFWANGYIGTFTGTDTCIITFRTNLLRAAQENSFTVGSDTIEVRTGYGSSAASVRANRMAAQGLTTIYSFVDTVITKLNSTLYYQFYKVKNRSDFREIYYNYTYNGTDPALAEKRGFTVTSKAFTVWDTSKNVINDRRMPRFQNTSTVGKAIKALFTVDVRPAIYQVTKGDSLEAIQGGSALTIKTPGQVMALGCAINGPATGTWATWGSTLMTDTLRHMYDDGTHGDLVSGDSIFSLTINFLSTATVTQEFKFGIGGGDNEGGRGGYGNNHLENLGTDSVQTIASQFGSMNPNFYNAWDFDLKKPRVTTDVFDQTAIPAVFSLEQNFPNPFNPTTQIRYALPMEKLVSLKVYNMLGQVVETLVESKQSAGTHTVSFDAAKHASGLYFYQIVAGDFVSVKKMMLLK